MKIRCCETEIREKIFNDCNNSGFFAICCDETTDVSTKEQMSICVRFVEDSYIREEFIGFVELRQMQKLFHRAYCPAWNSGDWISQS